MIYLPTKPVFTVCMPVLQRCDSNTLKENTSSVSLCFQIFPKKLLTVKLKFIIILLNPNN